MSIAFIAGVIVIAIIVAIAIAQRSGPRVTQITTRREKDDPEDGDDA